MHEEEVATYLCPKGGSNFVASFLVGSTSAGFGHNRSDMDIIVLMRRGGEGTTTKYFENQRVDIETLNDTYLSDMVKLLSEIQIRASDVRPLDLGESRWRKLLRLMSGKPVDVVPELESLVHQFYGKRIRALRCYTTIKSWEILGTCEDLIGFGEDGDIESFGGLEKIASLAVLDTLLLWRVSPFPGEKWRVAKMRKSGWPSQLSDMPNRLSSLRRIQMLMSALQLEAWGSGRYRNIVDALMQRVGEEALDPSKKDSDPVYIAQNVIPFADDEGVRMVDINNLYKSGERRISIPSLALWALYFVEDNPVQKFAGYIGAVDSASLREALSKQNQLLSKHKLICE